MTRRRTTRQNVKNASAPVEESNDIAIIESNIVTEGPLVKKEHADDTMNWNKLPGFLQAHTISFLDFGSRYALSKCSKKMWEIEKIPKIFIQEIKFERVDGPPRRIENRLWHPHLLSVKFDSWTPKKQKFYFSRCENVGADHEYERTPRSVADSVEDGLQLILDLMKRGNYYVERLSIDIPNWDRSSIPIEPFSCKTFKYFYRHADSVANTLNLIQSNVEKLEIIREGSVRLPPEVQNAKTLSLWSPCNFTEQQFLALKASKIILKIPNIEESILNQFIRRWINSPNPENLVFSIIYTHDKNIDLILRHIPHTKWDINYETNSGEAFAKPYRETIAELNFSPTGIETHYRIMHKSGRAAAMVTHSSDVFLFVVTGKWWSTYNCVLDNVPPLHL
ncbi:unnamed protein product [Caenorhabditis bovis]|uniref:Sdz-33 F-box domain-containing protein n=1 Tax=Caenorhabditis bovis TaxID=2654633 RepID=A0A8S1FC89_9PELO|nr:unnamed protein product [Caenorhabditis bovis]